MTGVGSGSHGSIWPAGAAALVHLAALPFFAASGLLAPGWAVLVFLGLWLAAASVITVWWDRRAVVLTVPVISIGTWFLAMTAGERLLGWTG